jgi:ABC-type thiamine transport system substrate-binding protein
MWYDVKSDTETPLKVYPIAMMDTTMRKYMQLSPDAAIALSTEMINRIRSAHGVALLLWHNETLSETDGWQGWRKVWEDQLAFGNA